MRVPSITELDGPFIPASILSGGAAVIKLYGEMVVAETVLTSGVWEKGRRDTITRAESKAAFLIALLYIGCSIVPRRLAQAHLKEVRTS
jgi:hypothetical protein